MMYDDILYSVQCCALCAHFEEGTLGRINSTKGNCAVYSDDVWSHQYCTKFEFDPVAKKEFKIIPKNDR